MVEFWLVVVDNRGMADKKSVKPFVIHHDRLGFCGVVDQLPIRFTAPTTTHKRTYLTQAEIDRVIEGKWYPKLQPLKDPKGK